MILSRLHKFFWGGATTLSTLFLAPQILQAAPSLQLELDPPLAETVPFSHLTQLTLTAEDESGKPIENVNFHVQLETPPKSPWLTSDFPIVEGSTLLDLRLPTSTGTVQFEQMMPIRGHYDLTITVYPQQAGVFEPFTEVLTFKVPENSIKYRNFALLIGTLLIIGFGGGWVIGGDQTVLEGETAPRRVQLLLSTAILITIGVMLYVSISAERADAHVDHDQENKNTPRPKLLQETTPLPETVVADLDFRGEPQVGYATPFTFKVHNANGEPLKNARLEIQSYALEYDRLVLSFNTLLDETGSYTWNQQFFDGAPHEVIVTVLPPLEPVNQESAFEPFSIRETVEVIGVAPPLSVRLITLGYFTSALGLGTGAGFMLKQRMQQQQ